MDRPSKRLTGFLLSVLLLVIIWQSPASFRWRIFFCPFRHLQKQETLLERDQNSLQRGGGAGGSGIDKGCWPAKKDVGWLDNLPGEWCPLQLKPPTFEWRTAATGPSETVGCGVHPHEISKKYVSFWEVSQTPQGVFLLGTTAVRYLLCQLSPRGGGGLKIY